MRSRRRLARAIGSRWHAASFVPASAVWPARFRLCSLSPRCSRGRLTVHPQARRTANNPPAAMDEEWDVDNVEGKFDLAMRSNKWEGEDEEEEVKDSWEDVEEEKKDVEKPAEAPKAKAKPKKALAERIEEREKKAREEAEQKAKEKEEALTPEERRTELLRRQRLQEEADLRLAMETFGVPERSESSNESLDAMVPDTKEEFEQFGAALSQKINQFNKHAEFPPFAEELIKSIALNLSSHYLKKVKNIVDNLLIEKQKMEKGDKAKKSKGKGKAKLKIEGDNTLLSEYGDYVYDEFNDFM